jgi:hypothetical protein
MLVAGVVRAAVLDGNLDHSATRRGFAVTAAKAFDESGWASPGR